MKSYPITIYPTPTNISELGGQMFALFEASSLWVPLKKKGSLTDVATGLKIYILVELYIPSLAYKGKPMPAWTLGTLGWRSTIKGT